MDARDWGYLGLGVIAIGFGIFNIWLAYRSYQKIINSPSWPAVAGKIISSKVKTTYGSKGGRTYQPEVTYRYSVIGLEYTRFVKRGSTLFESVAEDFIAKLPIGSSIKIFYDPQNPRDCVSEYDEEGVSWLGVGAILLGLAILAWVFTHGAITPGPGTR